MKSTIRVDFAGLDDQANAFQPVIRVNLEDSEDPRDGLLNAFFQALGGESNWLRVEFSEHTIDEVRYNKRIMVYPVTPKELPETKNIINKRVGETITSEGFNRLPSRFQVGESINFTTQNNESVIYLGKEIEYLSGKITSVRFTESKVWYDILDNYSGKVFKDIPSDDVKQV